MKSITITFLFIVFKSSSCQDFKELFQEINKKVQIFDAQASDIAWESSINPSNRNLSYKSATYQKDRIKWQQQICNELATLHRRQLLNSTQSRQTYLLCRGPKFTFEEARLTSTLYEELQITYTDVEICITTDKKIQNTNLTHVEEAISNYLKDVKKVLSKEYLNHHPLLLAAKLAVKETKYRGVNVVCLKGEDDFQKLMEFSRNADVLEWLWLVWREIVGPSMKRPFRELVEVENQAARRNGYPDIGASWRDDQEIPQLKQYCRRLYNRVKPLYKMLHGVVRFYLKREYGDIVSTNGPIPAHLLGNLWAQNWEPLADLILPKTINLDDSIRHLNWTVKHMVKRAEDFYQSLGLPAMTDTFWRKSVMTRHSENTRCHGTAADMFKQNDFRLLYCSGTNKEDFYVLHHELGHIQYYMAYERQPALFRQANTALHEAIGDTIMYGVLTPQHLHRLGLINDTLLFNTHSNDLSEGTVTVKLIEDLDIYDISENYGKNVDEEIKIESLEDVTLKITTDDVLMLQEALNKIPQIPFALLLDEYRWKVFAGEISHMDLNDAFWQMALDLQGVTPPIKRGEEYFDVGAKFHVPDNTPYIRYFLSSFLQHQLFESLCKAAVFGRRGVKEPLPATITMNRCDIYGSKTAGKILNDIMSRGHSQHWKKILQETTGQDDISSLPLERYYRPLYKLLNKLIRLYRIPVGW